MNLMKSKLAVGIILLALFGSCSRELPEKSLSRPGFGVTQTRIIADGSETELPVLLNTTDIIKGLQFTLVWDVNQVRVGEPRLTETNPDFTVSVGNSRNGRMKVLVFSMTGGAMNTTDPEILKLPVRVIDPKADEVQIRLDKAVFAGPHAKSYAIPVTHAQLTVERS